MDTINCKTCNKPYSPSCDYRQGRCPHHTPMLTIPTWRVVVYMLIAPLVIAVWCIMHPKQVWEQAKKDWKL